MSTNSFVGKGTVFNRKNPTSSVFEPIAEIKKIGGPSATRETVDVTTLDSEGGYREFIGALRDGGEVSLDMNFTAATYTIMKEDFESDDARDYQIILPDSGNTTLEFTGLVTDLPVDIPIDDVVSCNITIKVSGQTDLTSVDVIASVETLADIPAANGTQLADATLPTTVEVTFDDDSTDDLDVTWDAGTPLYDGGTAGTYAFVGTIAIAAGQANPEGYQAAVNVVVAEA